MDNTIWLTSDSHFQHSKDFIYEVRGFASVEDMNEAIIENWNSVIKEGDIVYHLGDVIMGELESGLELVRQLKGKKFLAFGNHDTQARISAFEHNLLFKNIQMGYRIKSGKMTLILTHYPTIVENTTKEKVISFHGHTHATSAFYNDQWNMFNVGMDAHNCKLVNLEDAVAAIKQKKKDKSGQSN